MDDKVFQELLENARLAAAWFKGENTASRIIVVGEPDPRGIQPGAHDEIRPPKADALAKPDQNLGTRCDVYTLSRLRERVRA